MKIFVSENKEKCKIHATIHFMMDSKFDPHRIPIVQIANSSSMQEIVHHLEAPLPYGPPSSDGPNIADDGSLQQCEGLGTIDLWAVINCLSRRDDNVTHERPSKNTWTLRKNRSVFSV